MGRQQKKQKVWVLTTEYNDYDQYGAYFVEVFAEKPTLEQIAPIIDQNGGLPREMGEAIALCEHVRKGGGRKETERQWYNLEERELK